MKKQQIKPTEWRRRNHKSFNRSRTPKTTLQRNCQQLMEILYMKFKKKTTTTKKQTINNLPQSSFDSSLWQLKTERHQYPVSPLFRKALNAKRAFLQLQMKMIWKGQEDLSTRTPKNVFSLWCMWIIFENFVLMNALTVPQLRKRSTLRIWQPQL